VTEIYINDYYKVTKTFTLSVDMVVVDWIYKFKYNNVIYIHITLEVVMAFVPLLIKVKNDITFFLSD